MNALIKSHDSERIFVEYPEVYAFVLSSQVFEINKVVKTKLVGRLKVNGSSPLELFCNL